MAQGDDESIQTFVDLIVEQSESYKEQDVIEQLDESEFVK
jgi:hypothetical protein